jgi:hypothetical protein
MNNHYDELILTLIQRMSNLEKLVLYLQVNHYDSFIDGNNLKKKFPTPFTTFKKFSI